jgi:O-antigen ligase
MSAVLLMIVTVFLTASRGGLIGLVTTGLILFVRRRGGHGGRMVYAVAIIGVGALLIQEIVPEQIMERITNIPGISDSSGRYAAGEGSTERRKYTYEIGIEIWKKAPIVGVGPGNWPYMRFITDPLRSAAVAHNSYLAVLVEGGLITLALYLVLFYMTIRDLLRCERSPEILARARADGLQWLLPATRVSLIALLVFSLFADLWDLIFAYFLLAVAAVLIQRYRPTAPTVVPA